MDSLSQMHLSQKKTKRLSEEELQALWAEYFADRTNKKVKDTLIVQYIYLTKYVVGRLRVSLPETISSDDIASFGIEGLIKAIEKYENDKNTRFETFALTKIRGAIIDAIRSQDWIPRAVRKKQKEINAIIQILQKELGRIPTEEEIAQKANITVEKLQEIMRLANTMTVTSLNVSKDKQEQGVEIIDTIEDDKNLAPEEELEKKDSKKDLIKGLSRLPERERLLLTLYYHENMTFMEIASILKVSESRCCQLHAQAIMKLRNILTSNRLELRKIV